MKNRFTKLLSSGQYVEFITRLNQILQCKKGGDPRGVKGFNYGTGTIWI